MHKLVRILLVCVLSLLSVNNISVKASTGCNSESKQEYLEYFRYNALKLNNNDSISYKRCSDYSNHAYFTFTMASNGYLELSNLKQLNSNGVYRNVFYIISDLKGNYFGSYKSNDEVDDNQSHDQFILGLKAGEYLLNVAFDESETNVENSNNLLLKTVSVTNFENEAISEFEYNPQELKLGVPFSGTYGSKSNIYFSSNGAINGEISDLDDYYFNLLKPTKVRLTITRDLIKYPIQAIGATQFKYYFVDAKYNQINITEKSFKKDGLGNIYRDVILPAGINNFVISYSPFSGARYTIKLDPAPYSGFGSTLKVNPVHTASTTLSGKGVVGSLIKAYQGSTYLGQAIVNNSGTFKITIPKQPVGTTITLKNTKFWYKESTTTTKVLNYQNTFSVNDINTKSTYITGKAIKASLIQVYVGTKLIGTSRVSNLGTFKVIIPKQKSNTIVTVKISKEGYANRQIKIKV